MNNCNKMLTAFLLFTLTLYTASPLGAASAGALSLKALAADTSSNALPLSAQKSLKFNARIVTLSPHLSEIVFALKRQNQLVGVSDFSNYPLPQGCINVECKTKIASVASYQGANIAEIIRLKPDIILAWEGGNKTQDIARLEQLGFEVYRSSPKNIEELMNEVLAIGELLNATAISQRLELEMQTQLAHLKQEYMGKKTTALYYMSLQPLSGMGSDEWLNSLLALCNITNVYADLPASYAQFSIADILRKQPKVIISAVGQNKQIDKTYWAAHFEVFQAKLVSADPDSMHRFSPRVLAEVAKLCNKIHY